MCEDCKYGKEYKHKDGSIYWTCNKDKSKLHKDGYTGITGVPDYVLKKIKG